MIEEFKLNDNEKLAAEKFEEEHVKCAKKHPTTIGGNITYRFTPTSIGTGKVIRCNICGKELNITDYDLW